MYAAINLNTQFYTAAIEIESISTDRTLPSEMYTQRIPAKILPQYNFGGSGVTSKLLCSIIGTESF